jgi:hypothetical protein
LKVQGECVIVGCHRLAMWRHEACRFDLCDEHARDDERFREAIPLICPRCRRSPLNTAPEARCAMCWERIGEPARWEGPAAFTPWPPEGL